MQHQQQQTHDLHFEVQGGDDYSSSSQQQLRGAVSAGSNNNYVERPLRGEMNHLPDHVASTTSNNNNSNNNPGGVAGSIQFIQDQLKQSSHPTVIIFHILFKALALFIYSFGNWFVGTHHSAKFILLTVICILLLAADFWVVKNVTGRLLVGLRWWNKVDEDDTVWIFESAENKIINKFDRTVFWTVLYVTPILWAALFVFGLLHLALDWLLICVIALSLSSANVYGYYKCSKEQAAQFQQMMQSSAQHGAMAMMRSNMLSVLTGTTTTPGSSRNIV
jgi:Eukaryotic protein of unknown function (DUF846)